MHCVLQTEMRLVYVLNSLAIICIYMYICVCVCVCDLCVIPTHIYCPKKKKKKKMKLISPPDKKSRPSPKLPKISVVNKL